MGGERNYDNLKGDTGPLVYPAGFLYIFAALRWLTDGQVPRAQVPLSRPALALIAGSWFLAPGHSNCDVYCDMYCDMYCALHCVWYSVLYCAGCPPVVQVSFLVLYLVNQAIIFSLYIKSKVVGSLPFFLSLHSAGQSSAA